MVWLHPLKSWRIRWICSSWNYCYSYYSCNGLLVDYNWLLRNRWMGKFIRLRGKRLNWWSLNYKIWSELGYICQFFLLYALDYYNCGIWRCEWRHHNGIPLQYACWVCWTDFLFLLDRYYQCNVLRWLIFWKFNQWKNEGVGSMVIETWKLW